MPSVRPTPLAPSDRGTAQVKVAPKTQREVIVSGPRQPDAGVIGSLAQVLRPAETVFIADGCTWLTGQVPER